jgi:protein-disulfide isomerase
MEEGRKAGLQGTPTLYFNGKVYQGEANKEAILAHIDQLMSKLGAEKPVEKAKK